MASEDKLERINELREKVSELTAEKDRLEGSIEIQEKALAEMEKECREKFDCEISELPALTAKLEAEADALISEVEESLKGE